MRACTHALTLTHYALKRQQNTQTCIHCTINTALPLSVFAQQTFHDAWLLIFPISISIFLSPGRFIFIIYVWECGAVTPSVLSRPFLQAQAENVCYQPMCLWFHWQLRGSGPVVGTTPVNRDPKPLIKNKVYILLTCRSSTRNIMFSSDQLCIKCNVLFEGEVEGCGNSYLAKSNMRGTRHISAMLQ